MRPRATKAAVLCALAVAKALPLRYEEKRQIASDLAPQTDALSVCVAHDYILQGTGDPQVAYRLADI